MKVVKGEGMSKALARALTDRSKAEAQVDRILKRDYPPGAEVVWKKNGIHKGIVIQNGYGDRIKVKNERTNREFWVYAYTIIEAMESSQNLTKGEGI